MTDITELAQSHELRNKVNHRLYAALEFQGTSGENATITLSIDECKSIIEAMDGRLALVEALEKAQQERELFRRRFNLERSILEDADRDLEELRQRIAELESRTVKLPKPISVLHRREFTEAHCAIYAYPEAEVNAALDEVGIKWEAE